MAVQRSARVYSATAAPPCGPPTVTRCDAPIYRSHIAVVHPGYEMRARARRWRCSRSRCRSSWSAPLARLGPLQLTSVELVLYVALALSAAAIAIDLLPDWKRLPWRQIAARHAGVLAFAVVLVLSALRAPLGRADAIKFALRNLGGIALYVAAANLLRAPAAALTTAVAMSIGARRGRVHHVGRASPARAPRRRSRLSMPAASTCSACRARADRSSIRTSPRCTSKRRCPSCSRPGPPSTRGARRRGGPARCSPSSRR